MTPSDPQPIALTHRDPDAVLYRKGTRFIRGVGDHWDFNTVSKLPGLQSLIADHRLVPTRRLSPDQWPELPVAHRQVLEHQPVWFPSYPYEWPASMLHEAANLTLGLARALVEDGYGLKDATPFNILFEGVRPVFVDWPSIQPRDPRDPLWLAQTQFTRTFLVPLLLYREKQLSPDRIFSARPEGLETREAYRMAGTFRRWLPPSLEWIALPACLGEPVSSSQTASVGKGSPDKARFILSATLKRLHRQLQRIKPTTRSSPWTRYMDDHCPYSEQQRQTKEDFVVSVLRTYRPATVLDLGGNTGHFSALACAQGARSVLVDADEAALNAAHERALAGGLDLQPLHIHLTHPSPAGGWLNGEQTSFLDRCRGKFDLVMALAVVHHLLAGRAMKLESVVELLSRLAHRRLLVEWVEPEDPSFVRLSRGRTSDLSRAAFERALETAFTPEKSLPLPGGHRHLYLLRKRS